ncbi:MAG TPA: hypothetical protein H9913_08590 [Candidatus Blautia stercoripullorum]|uniref:Uncharacterized protein n=1 Tax=Candidatus Blautia stercoripullorum TaxID=2838502 RepID=A0A9D2RAA3_9FIRM|nr:hypothetical protein [Clostridiales bacterium]HJD40075.1 hypothetical protein [Candidatus Blautia stercoripullorum]
MKKKILKLSLGIFFTFGFCTVTSIRAEEVLVPQVSVVRANYQDGMFSVANLPASCLRTDEQWGKGVWVAQEYESIWGGTEYRTMFLSDCILEEHKDYIVVKDCPTFVIQDSLKPLQEGEKVKVIE